MIDQNTTKKSYGSPVIWRRDRMSLYFTWKTTCLSQEKEYGQDTGKHSEFRNQYQISDL
jgi:hypothetical protein